MWHIIKLYVHHIVRFSLHPLDSLKYPQYSPAAIHDTYSASSPSKHTASLQSYASHLITHLAPPLYWQAFRRQPDK